MPSASGIECTIQLECLMCEGRIEIYVMNKHPHSRAPFNLGFDNSEENDQMKEIPICGKCFSAANRNRTAKYAVRVARDLMRDLVDVPWALADAESGR